MPYVDPKRLPKHIKERRRAEPKALKEATRAIRREGAVQPTAGMAEIGRNASQSGARLQPDLSPVIDH
jgi:hypothetical protein